MAKSLSVCPRAYILGEFNHRRLSGDTVIVSSFNGGWALLNNMEFKLLCRGSVEYDPELYNLLVQEGIIHTEGNLAHLSKQCREKHLQLYDMSTLQIVVPTIRCNQKCAYCYARSKSSGSMGCDMDVPTAKSTVDFIFQCPARAFTLEFQGGEALLNLPIVKYIVNYSKQKMIETKKNVRFRMVTNLTLLDENILAWIIENNIELNSSLDGPKFIHDRNRVYGNGKGSYDDVMRGLALVKSKGIPVGMMPTITRYSLPYWKEIVDEYVRLDLVNFWARRLSWGGYACEQKESLGYSAEEFLDFWKKCLEYIFQLNREGKRIREGNVALILRNIIFSKRFNQFVCMSSPCGCACSQTSYDQNGDIFTCDEARSFELFKIGNVKKSTYKEIFGSETVLNFIDLSSGLSFDCASCAYRPFCGPCIVDEYGESGGIIKKPNSFNCAIKKGIIDYIFKEVIPNEEKLGIAKGWMGLEGATHVDITHS